MTHESSLRTVDCTCDAALVRPVEHHGDVHACMRCGAVSVSDAIWSEPRPHDIRIHGYTIVDVDADVLAWLAAWPRLIRASTAMDESFLSAAVRAPDVATLEALESSERLAQKPMRYGERLRRAGFPSSPPPPKLGEGLLLPGGRRVLFEYAKLWSALQLDDASPADVLYAHAKSGWGARLVDELVVRRPTLADEVVALLRDPSAAQRAIGCDLVERLRVSDSRVPDALADRLLDPTLDHEELYVVIIAARAIRAQALAPQLRALAERAKGDYYLHKRLIKAATDLEGG